MKCPICKSADLTGRYQWYQKCLLVEEILHQVGIDKNTANWWDICHITWLKRIFSINGGYGRMRVPALWRHVPPWNLGGHITQVVATVLKGEIHLNKPSVRLSMLKFARLFSDFFFRIKLCWMEKYLSTNFWGWVFGIPKHKCNY